MKRIILFLVAGAMAILPGSCTKDKGNYDYKLSEEPVVDIHSRYVAFMDGATRSNLVVDPEVEYSDMSKLRFKYEIFDPSSTTTVVKMLEGSADGSIDDPMDGLDNGAYSARLTLTVLDDSGITADSDNRGMKYYYDFSILLGGTAYTTGSIVLVNDGGTTKLHIIAQDSIFNGGILREDIYALENNGAAIPGAPIQIVSPTSWMGASSLTLESHYYVMTNNGGQTDGVIVDVNSLKKTADFATSIFASAPASMANPGMLVSQQFYDMAVMTVNKWKDMNYWVALIDNNVYSMGPATTGSGMIDFGSSASIASDISFIAHDRKASPAPFGNIWGWNSATKRLHTFAGIPMTIMGSPLSLCSAANMGSEITLDGATEAEWDPMDVGMDFVALLFWVDGGVLIADDAGTKYQLTFKAAQGGNPMSTAVSVRKKKAFPRADLIKPDTKWLIRTLDGVLYFSSGSEIYYYNPSSAVDPAPMGLGLTGDVTMLRFRDHKLANPPISAGGHTLTEYDYRTLEIGTEGHLYRVELNQTGKIGTVVRDIPMTGAPVDIYNRVEE